MTTLVLGHAHPDTDSTGSPIIWAWYMNEVLGRTAEPVLQGEPNTEALWMLDRFGLAKPRIVDTVGEGDRIVIVDTNNPAELPDTVNDAEITAIIDHHRLVAGLHTREPIDVTIRPLACTATILHELMGADAARMTDDIKGAMLVCILSDTLAFRSPTTTPTDRALAQSLADALAVDISALSAEMFAAKSDVSAYSEAALLRMDSKVFEHGDNRVLVSVLETTSPDQILGRKDALVAAMPAVAAEDGVDRVLLFVIDILNEGATMLVPDAATRAVAENSFATVCGDADTVWLPGVMSRKKQIIPSLAI